MKPQTLSHCAEARCESCVQLSAGRQHVHHHSTVVFYLWNKKLQRSALVWTKWSSGTSQTTKPGFYTFTVDCPANWSTNAPKLRSRTTCGTRPDLKTPVSPGDKIIDLRQLELWCEREKQQVSESSPGSRLIQVEVVSPSGSCTDMSSAWCESCDFSA